MGEKLVHIMSAACDRTRAGKDHVKVQVADWHALMALADEAKATNTRAPAEQTGWRDIETAPKDGTMFLIYVPSAKSRNISTSRGGQLWCQDDWAKRGGYTVCDDHGRPVKATHWQPLPAPPGTTRAPADLRSALEPFAREADAQERVTSFSSGDSVIPRTSITIGQLRRARAAFAALAPTKGDAA